MILSELIGQKISKIRYSHKVGDGMQQFQSYIRLADKKIICLPKRPDNSLDLEEYYNKHKECSFDDAKRCALASRLLFRNKKIVDIHFGYLDDEAREDMSGILELENGIFITENNAGPEERGDIDLLILKRDQFEAWKDEETEYRSFKNSIHS